MGSSWVARGATALANGTVVSILMMASAVSCAAFIFSGPLSGGLGFAVNSALLCIVAGGIVSLRSGFRFAVAGPDATLTAALAFAALPIAAAGGARAVPTTLMVLTAATAFTGVLLYCLGRVGAGRVIRFLPYPMIGGFGAASGLIAIFGGLQLLAGRPLRLDDVAHVASLHVEQLVLGVLFAAVLLASSRRWGPIAMPIAIVAALVGGGLAAVLSHVPFDSLQHDGWFLAVPSGPVWLPELAPWHDVDWRAVATRVPSVIAVGVIATMTLLVNSTGLEVLARRDVDLDHELRTAGIGNAVGSLAGAMISFSTYSRSSLNYLLGTRDRAAGVVVAALAVAVLALGSGPIVSRVPTIVPAALLISTGAAITFRWLIASRRRLSFGDMATIWAIVAIVLSFGYVAAMIGGVVLSCVTFALRYGRIDSIESRLSAATYHSSLQRSQREMEVLTFYGGSAHVYLLRGYIFFGMAESIYRELIDRIAEVDGPAWIVADFSGVTGMDSSVASAFEKLLNNLDPPRVRVLLAGMRGEVARRWHTLPEGKQHALVFDDLDLAMEWCENDLLRQFDSYSDEATSFESWIAEQVGEELAPTLLGYLERVELDTGAALFSAGDDGGRMFFIESGRVAIVAGGEVPRRVRSLGPQTLVGELGLYRHQPHDTSAIAESPTVAHVFSRDALDAVEGGDPILATWFHAAIIRALADRLEYQPALVAPRA
jgi:SulP family sulfate permease